jgi:hypothetical protein
MRLDAIRHYVENPETPFGLGLSLEPSLGRLSDGSLILLDGNHRMAAAMLTNRSLEVCINNMH